MAPKTPKRPASTKVNDDTSTTRDICAGDSGNAQTHLTGVHQRPAEPVTDASASNTISPHVPPRSSGTIISEITTSNAISPHLMVSWPREAADQLIRIGDSGLFMSRGNNLYADIEGVWISRIEPNTNGTYHVHFPFAPEHPGPVVQKANGKAHWVRLDRHGQHLKSAGSMPDLPVKPLAPALADKLTLPDSQGIRWFKKQTYVDLQGIGTVRVHSNATGQQQVTTGAELTPSGPVLERIEGTTYWRRKALEASGATYEPEDAPGPSKRPRSDPEIAEQPTEALAQRLPEIFPSDLPSTNPYLWASWGQTEKPASYESVQINGLHYRVAAKGKYPPKTVAFLQSPKFAPSNFEHFERMLLESPELQPVPAILNGMNLWEVQSQSRLFDKPITQAVADSFKDFTPHTSKAVAERLFVSSGDSPLIASDGLYTTSVTLRHWKKATGVFEPEFENPLDLLPVATRADDSGQVISVKPHAPTDPLQRLDFSLHRHDTEWTRFSAAPSNLELRQLVSNLLRRNGYYVFPFGQDHGFPKLVFKREFHNKIYYLKLGIMRGENLKVTWKPGSEIITPNLKDAIGQDAMSALLHADAQGDVVWLVGGLQTAAPAENFVFILRER